jgi:hypothetical protein
MAQRSTRRDRENQIMDTRPERATLNWTRSANSHTGRRHGTAASEAGHMSAPDHAPCFSKRFFLHRWGRPYMSIRTVLNTAPHSARRPSPDASNAGSVFKDDRSLRTVGRSQCHIRYESIPLKRFARTEMAQIVAQADRLSDRFWLRIGTGLVSSSVLGPCCKDKPVAGTVWST